MILGEVRRSGLVRPAARALDGRRFVLVRDPDSGARHVAVDLVDAAAGTTVLVATDEAAAAARRDRGVDAAVVALVSGYDGQPDR